MARVQKEVRYLNKDFGAFREGLVEFAKSYYPNTYNDFNEASPGMMFIEMASYVGDVLSYYVDSQFKEMLLAYAEDRKTIYEMAQTFGYKPKVTSPSFTTIDIFQTVPATGNGTSVKPDMKYALTVNEGTIVNASNGTVFRTLEDCNFKFSSSFDPLTIDVYEVNQTTKVPSIYLLKKSARVSSGTIKTEYFTFGTAEQYPRIKLQETKIIEILSVTDSDGNKWYEVPYLAQDTTFIDVENTAANDPSLVQYNDTVPYLLKLKKTPRRFVTYIVQNGQTELRFGAGVSDSPDEEIIPNPSSVGSNLPGTPSFLDTYFDPANFLKTKAYGQAPANTTLTIKYAYGGGLGDNVATNTINNVGAIAFTINEASLDATTVTSTKNSVAATNPYPATGGKSAESTVEIKNNALAFFQAQGRAVTKEDYITRTYAMNTKYGAVSKAYIVQDEQLNIPNMQVETTAGSGVFIDERNLDQLKAKDVVSSIKRLPNPLALNLYTLGYNENKKLTQLNVAVKENLKTYLGQYRLVTDAVNIKNAWIINIGVKFNFIARQGFNKSEVTLRCIGKIKEFFNIDRWQINQPIVIAELAAVISNVDGVGAIVAPVEDNPQKHSVLVTNKWQTANGYSGNVYDINYATKNGIIYPSLDPSIFELKYPNTDIEGRAVGDSIGQVF
jgi:hypothetical protein|tara:strand:- start:82 stop:2088 length:2007 start_codon:yes stop_codon:yes gene_type:complete